MEDAPAVWVANAADLDEEGSRLHLQVKDRYITLLRHKNFLYCFDSVCFHAGGPLGVGDIEEVANHACIKCPWHNYLITLETGEKLYQGVQMKDGKMVPGKWQSVGQKQRTHVVVERADGIFVQLKQDGKVESDEYAFKRECAQMMIASGSTGKY
ncbi:hypothetical protein CYMTET_11536 [Cymbomonas tetramitiformis]|uniref:Rieske domain-containing protein n=1 Tax=Cymbomonas tetramitiformis TaxID=36881 RepID=A0AAE0LDD0_9CHLO|nr:hypothetical protein CYMTET_11536 [Cymbomonas tetramitiformis]